MKDRLVTLLGGLLALYIVIALLAPPSQPDYASRPLTTDRDRHGLALLYEWLGNNNVAVHALRQRYDDLYSLAKLPDVGNLIIINLPLKIESRNEEEKYLREWIAQGNSVLFLAAHSDYPAWSFNQGRINRSGHFPLLSSLGFSISRKVDDEENDTDESDTDENKDDQTKLSTVIKELDKTGIKQGQLKSAALNNPAIQTITVKHSSQQEIDWQLEPRELSRASRSLLVETDNPASTAMWQVRIGSGTAIISRYADLFSNNWLDEGDHARLFDSLLQQHLGENGYVVFDDMHQGLTELYDPEAFYDDPRLHNTLWFLFGFWLLYLIGRSNRLAPPLTLLRKAHAADFIRAMGGLFARRLSNPATALGLIRSFFNEIRQQYNLPMNSEPVWELLEAAPRIQQTQLVVLQNSYLAAQQNKKQNLVKLHNQLRETRKSLL